ncbi:MAG: hypothetical protein HUJ62_08545, partial [Streptococcus gallolyticus]|nr:hypothetical protein [Streptococcus gallolyticus]
IHFMKQNLLLGTSDMWGVGTAQVFDGTKWVRADFNQKLDVSNKDIWKTATVVRTGSLLFYDLSPEAMIMLLVGLVLLILLLSVAMVTVFRKKRHAKVK